MAAMVATPTSSLRADENMYRRIVEALPGGIWIVDLQGQTIFSNRCMAEILGVEIESMSEQSCFECVFPDDLAEAQGHFEQGMAGSADPFDFRLRRRDGSVQWVNISCNPMLDEHGDAIGLLGVFTDIGQRKTAEARLGESEERFRNMADTAPVMIWVSGPDKLCSFFNRGWLTFTGCTLDEAIGTAWSLKLHPDDRDGCLTNYSSAFDDRRSYQKECRLRRADGEYRWVLTTGAPRFESSGAFAGYVGSCTDITDLKRSQEEAFASQKLESVGMLAGGISHDFNNLLGGILAEAELAATELAAGESPLDSIQRIRAVATRGAEIVRELMIYSGQDDKTDPIEPVDLPRLVEEMLELLKVSISKHAVLETNLQHNLPAVLGRASQIRQIVMNLIINASEAIGKKNGVIKVTASRMTVPQEPGANRPLQLPSGDCLELDVSDTGGGMTADVRAKVFDPFFSTKFAGRGLGLAVVQRIVRDHGGAINVITAPGQGTTFKIVLPCVGGRDQPSHGATALAPGKEDRRASGTVLIVEDEGVLRLAVSKMLRRNGFGVIEAIDGSSALELVRAHENEIDVMLLDITLPGKSSLEVLEEAQYRRPNLKVILTSAYSRETVHASLGGLQVERFIRKPFRFVDLMSMLQDALSD